MNESTPQTAIIGLGAMGMGIAKNIIQSGISLKGYDMSASAMEKFVKLGGVAAKQSEIAKEAKVIVIMVVNIAQVRDVLFEKKLAENIEHGTTIVLSSTVSPNDVRQLADDLPPGVLLLDAPVSGGKVGADSGELSVLASGSEAAFQQADGVLKAISKKVYHLGDTPGQAATYKVVHQLAAGVHLVTAAELMSLGVKAGCDADKLYDIVANSAGQSWMFKDRVPRILEDDYEPRSMVDIFVKDLNLVLKTAQECSAALPLTSAASQVLVAASSMGFGKLDDSAVVKVYEAINLKKIRE